VAAAALEARSRLPRLPNWDLRFLPNATVLVTYRSFAIDSIPIPTTSKTFARHAPPSSMSTTVPNRWAPEQPDIAAIAEGETSTRSHAGTIHSSHRFKGDEPSGRNYVASNVLNHRPLKLFLMAGAFLLHKSRERSGSSGSLERQQAFSINVRCLRPFSGDALSSLWTGASTPPR